MSMPTAVEIFGRDNAVGIGVVDLASLLTSVIAWLRRYVVVSDAQAVAIVLWAAHTHAINAADCTPYLQITSATRRAGKTRLLEVLEPIVARPWLTGRTSAAALVRKVDAETPTLLLDESDAAFNGEKEYAEVLRGQLNTGYRRSGKSTVCIGQGANITAKDFRTFSPKAIAGIGELPGTVADRAIKIELRRRTSGEPCERWRERDGHHEAAPLRERLSTWAAGAIDDLRSARPALPSSLSDRQADVWEPLTAIADQAGGSWPITARQAALELAGTAGDTDIHVELLQDIAIAFEESGLAFIASTELVTKLCERDDRPWATWRKGKPITGHGLARMLKAFNVVPIQNAARTARGYYRDRFEDAWTRYPPLQVSNCPTPNEIGGESVFFDCPDDGDADTPKTQKTPINAGVQDSWTLQDGEKGTSVPFDPDPIGGRDA